MRVETELRLRTLTVIVVYLAAVGEFVNSAISPCGIPGVKACTIRQLVRETSTSWTAFLFELRQKRRGVRFLDSPFELTDELPRAKAGPNRRAPFAAARAYLSLALQICDMLKQLGRRLDTVSTHPVAKRLGPDFEPVANSTQYFLHDVMLVIVGRKRCQHQLVE